MQRNTGKTKGMAARSENDAAGTACGRKAKGYVSEVTVQEHRGTEVSEALNGARSEESGSQAKGGDEAKAAMRKERQSRTGRARHRG